MSDTFFSGAPHWTWFIIPYFFVGGLAGGAYFLAAVLDWFGRPEDRPVVRTGYDIAAVGAILSGLLLTIDLGRDRKSTRLNSSHGYISYAVFCLKKKKKTKSYALT